MLAVAHACFRELGEDALKAFGNEDAPIVFTDLNDDNIPAVYLSFCSDLASRRRDKRATIPERAVADRPMSEQTFLTLPTRTARRRRRRSKN